MYDITFGFFLFRVFVTSKVTWQKKKTLVFGTHDEKSAQVKFNANKPSNRNLKTQPHLSQHVHNSLPFYKSCG